MFSWLFVRWIAPWALHRLFGFGNGSEVKIEVLSLASRFRPLSSTIKIALSQSIGHWHCASHRHFASTLAWSTVDFSSTDRLAFSHHRIAIDSPFGFCARALHLINCVAFMPVHRILIDRLALMPVHRIQLTVRLYTHALHSINCTAFLPVHRPWSTVWHSCLCIAFNRPLGFMPMLRLRSTVWLSCPCIAFDQPVGF